MKLNGFLLQFGVKLAYPFFYFGNWNKKTIIHNVDGKAKFKLRVNTSDKLTILEVWKTKTYIDQDFNINKNDVVVDIGANIGAFSVLAARKASDGRVFAYEPNKKNYSLLLKNKSLNNLRNLLVFNLAVAGKNGHVNLFISKLNDCAHSICNADSKNSVKVKSIRLRDIFAMNNLKKIDYLKIDAEGAEYDILLNTPAKIIRKVDKIVLEYHDNLNHGHGYKDLKEYLEGNGFKVEVGGNFLIRKIFSMGMIKARRENF